MPKTASDLDYPAESANEPLTGQGRQAERRSQAAAAKLALREAKDELSRDHILYVAERVFAEHGFTNAKMQDISREAGISLATLYQFYPGKKELYRGLLIARDRQMIDAVVSTVQAGLARPQSIPQILWMMQAHLHFLLQHPDYLRMILQDGHVWYHAAAQPTHDEKLLWERGVRIIQNVLEWGFQEGKFIGGNTDDQARLILSMQQTRLANWVMGGMCEPHVAVIKQVQTDFVRQFCHLDIARSLLSADGMDLQEDLLAQIARMQNG